MRTALVIATLAASTIAFALVPTSHASSCEVPSPEDGLIRACDDAVPPELQYAAADAAGRSCALLFGPSNCE